MIHPGMREVAAVALAALLCAGPLRADEDETGLDRAGSLRKEATSDWKAGRYSDAARKLAEAASIYEAAEGDHLADWAVAMRAQVWNLSRAGDTGPALDAFTRLLRGADRPDEIAGDLRSAYTAMYELARAQSSIESLIQVLEQCRKVLLEQELDLLAARALHDLGFLSSMRGAQERAISYYRKAIHERERIRDLLGRAWSLNNLAAALLDVGRPVEARVPLLRAYRAVHLQSIVRPQGAVGFNLLRIARTMREEGDDEEGSARAWIHELLATGLVSEQPRVVSLAYLQRLALELADEGEPLLDEARRAVDLKLDGVPGEVLVDLLLRAARAALQCGEPGLATQWLTRVEIGESPAAPHLQARLLTTRAVADLASGDTRAFIEGGGKAMEAWSRLGDRGGQDGAAERLAEAIRKWKVADDAGELLLELEELLRREKPGGTGAGARAGGDMSAYRELKVHDPLFTISMRGGQISVSDRVVQRRQDYPLTWVPKNLSFNGLNLTLHGAYVTVRSLNYGGAAAAGGAPGKITLGEMGDYYPVPDSGALSVLKNGATTYR